MDGEDWPDPLPKGWILKKFSNGKVWAHNRKTGQTFHTRKDLLRYVHYAETILPLFANKTIPYKNDQTISDSKGKAIIDNSSEASDDEGNSEEASDGEDGNSEEAYDDDSNEDDDSLYGGIDFSKGIWSVDAEIIERSFPQPERKKVQNDQQPRGKMKIHDGQQAKGKRKVNDDQQSEMKMKMEMKSGTDHERNKRNVRRRKFEMPPKRFRGWGRRKNLLKKP